MIYNTGDIHANQHKWVEQIHPALSSGDILIVNGDFGIGFWNGRYWSEETFFDWISEQEYTVLFADGNHENFNKLNGYPVELWNGGKVHKIRHNLIHLMRGEVYNIDGIVVFVFGGGYSMDKYRRQENVSWWPQEMPSEEEYKNAENNLRKANYQVDYIITHTAPSDSLNYLSSIQSLGIKKDVIEELPLNIFLDDIQRRVTYKHWFFGHFHVDIEIWRNQTAVFNSIRELQTGKIVRRWDKYEG
ncbi:MAG: metallophosphoesterase [Ruminococcus sp.]